MEEESSSGGGSGNGINTFMKHVFKFDNETKLDTCNLIQYSLLSIVPIVILNKLMHKYVPDSDDKKPSLEIVVEVVVQVIFTFLGLMLIHRLVTFVPTYSEKKYPEMHLIYIVSAVVLITTGLQTKLGEKVTILSDRVVDAWNGGYKAMKRNQVRPGTGSTFSVNPAAAAGGNPGMGASSPTTMPNPMMDTTPISSLPITQPQGMGMVQMDSGGMLLPAEPAAANAMLGGGSWGSAW